MAKRIDIAGQDRTAELVARIESEIAKHRPSSDWMAEFELRTATRLKSCQSEKAYLNEMMHLLQQKVHLVTRDFPIASRDTPASRLMARVKKFIWKLLRYQHDHMAGQQNHVNILLAHALAFEHEQRVQQEKRLTDLESRAHQKPTGHDQD
jgi:hypothetical protein